MSFFARAHRLLSLSLALGVAAPFAGLLLVPTSLRAQASEPISLTLSLAPRTYTGSTIDLDLNTELTISPGAKEDYTYKTTYSGKASAKNAGTYSVKVVATTRTAPLRTATATATLVVGKAPLSVTANDQARLFGAANPALTLDYDGLLGTDTSSVLNRRPVAGTAAKAASPVGEYDITVTGGSDNNYEIIDRKPGILYVTPAFPGTYEALLYDLLDFNLPIGKLTLTLPARGNAFTGRLELASEKSSLPLAGKLTPDTERTGALGSASRKNSTGLTFRVAFSIGDSGLVAEVFSREKGSTDDFSVCLTARPEPLLAYTADDPAPTRGAYTFALFNPFPSEQVALFPGGLGYATAGISTNGTLKLSGKFADGAPLTASARPDSEHRYRLFLRPYGSRIDSFSSGEMILEPHPDADRAGLYFVPAASTRLYLKKAKKTSGTADKLFPEGFGPVDSQIALDPWLPPVKAKAATTKAEAVEAVTLAQRLGLAFDNETEGLAEIEYGSAEDLGDSQDELPDAVEFGLTNKAIPILDEPPANPRSWKFTSFNPANGRFSGSFTLLDSIASPTTADPSRTVLKSRSVTFQGTLRQAPQSDSFIAAGYFILKDRPDEIEPATRSLEFKLSR